MTHDAHATPYAAQEMESSPAPSRPARPRPRATRSIVALASLPAAGQRVGPADAANMPKITASASSPALNTQAQASYYNIIGVEFLPDSTNTVVDTVVMLGDSSAAQNSTTLSRTT